MNDEIKSEMDEDEYNIYDLKYKEDQSKTMKVGELIDELQKYDRDTRVFITWESTINELTQEYIYIAYTNSLYLDGDGGFYKKNFKK
jgi:hypothetical protein